MRPQQRVEDITTVRILLMGDPGVGKTSLSYLLAANIPESTVRNSATGNDWCNIQVALHEYPSVMDIPSWASSSSSSLSSSASATSPFYDWKENRLHITIPERVPSKILYFLEFYDMNSDKRLHKEHRNRLYRHIDGIILVYNLTDMTTHDNLHDWLYEPLRQLSYQDRKSLRPRGRVCSVPLLVVGSKVDLLKTRRLRRAGGIADQCVAEEILLNCLDDKSLAADTRNGSKMRNFFNKVIYCKEKHRSRRN